MRVMKMLWVPAYKLLLIAVFLVGMAHIAFLPPFEGFDETAHWSSIRQWSHTGKMPVYGIAKLDAAIEDYPGPMPYIGPTPSGEVSGFQTYRSFDPTDPKGPKNTVPAASFQSGDDPNWQAQHPPLYYLSLIPVYKLISDASWAQQFLVLRTFSWIIACLGLMIAAEATCIYIQRSDLADTRYKMAPLMVVLWPFLVPQFFPEMARMGNDSLCLFWFSVCWAAVLQFDVTEKPIKWVLILGAALGAGLWTKAFFLPFSAAIFLYFVWRAFTDKPRFLRWMFIACVSLGFAAALGGGWYVYKWLFFGNFIGGDEMLQFSEPGGVWANFFSKVSLLEIIKGYAAIFISFVWGATWSIARVPVMLIAFPALLIAWCFIRYGMQFRQVAKPFVLPLFLALSMLIGLSNHMVIRIALTGDASGAPGWYFHILAPALACALAFGWPGGRIFSYVFASVMTGFTVYAWIMQLSVFSGCTVKDLSNGPIQLHTEGCLIEWSNLESLAYPELALLFLCMAIFFAGWSGLVKRSQS